MKQVFQDARTAEITVVDVPVPRLLAGCALIRTAASLVSAGTERAASDFAGRNLLQKARMRPDLVREVLSKINRDGMVSALSSVRGRLDQPSALGYSSAGTVLAVGEGVVDVKPGDRVACAGAGHAVHAEVACIPRLLLAPIPSAAVSFEEAAFTTLGSVALHGIRNAGVKLGEVVAVIGLGLLGQLTAQLLKAAGCRVLGMDISPQRAELAARMGADGVATSASTFAELCMRHSGGHGADSVLITAQSSSNDPVNLAGSVARNRAIIVAVGSVAMDIPRRTFYDKELDFRVSRSYGPGRYDIAYEQKGIDYPIGYVRWTETRNMEAFLGLLADQKLNLLPLITHRFPIARAQAAYDLINCKTQENLLGVLISYPNTAELSTRIDLPPPNRAMVRENLVRAGLLGAGSFATTTLLPALQRIRAVEMAAVASNTGARARYAANKFGFRWCTTDERELLNDASINTVFIASRHHMHAAQVVAALRAGKHVFCEKPLCLQAAELSQIVAAHDSLTIRKLLMVGFNRRFAPLGVALKTFLRDVAEPLALHYRVNAGWLPRDHWLNDVQQGGGRILGEICHFVDFLCFLTGSPPLEVEVRSLPNEGRYSNDNVICSLNFADGSLGTITYVANGDKSFSKERVEVFGGGRVAVLEDFRRLELVRSGGKQVLRSHLRPDKGHGSELQAFIAAIQNGGDSPTPLHEIVTTMRTTFALEESRTIGQPVVVGQLLPSHLAAGDAGLDQAS
jgi:predicted dehydrogenase